MTTLKFAIKLDYCFNNYSRQSIFHYTKKLWESSVSHLGWVFRL